MADLPSIAKSIFLGALEDCSIDRAMQRCVSVQDGQLRVCKQSFSIREIRRLRIVAAGKASSTMLAALRKQLPNEPEWDVRGILIAPEPPPGLAGEFQFFRGGHPLPNEASFAGARTALEMLRSIPPEESSGTLCIFLLSGGASAMLELPLDPAISLQDTATFHQVLVGSGAAINEINCVRKRFSAVKGGRLAAAAGEAACISLLISDVPAGHEDAIGSGPTLPDASTVEQCKDVLERYHLLPQFPAPVRRYFENLPEASVPPDLNRNRCGHCVLLCADDLAEAAARRATDLGWLAVVDHTSDEWPYEKAAAYLLQRLRQLRQSFGRACLIAGGEVLVQLPAGSVGVGGRNQQFALYGLTRLTPEDKSVAILSGGSDGIDGNSPAAGAVADERLLQTPEDRRLAEVALQNFDAYSYFAARGALLVTGSTGQNLRDLRILLCG